MRLGSQARLLDEAGGRPAVAVVQGHLGPAEEGPGASAVVAYFFHDQLGVRVVGAGLCPERIVRRAGGELPGATDSTMSDIVDAVRACRPAAAGGFPTSEKDPAPGHLVKLFTHVDRHRALYGRMLGEDGSPRFVARLHRRLAQAWFEQLTADADPEKANEADLQVRAQYVSGGLIALITQWAQGSFDGVGGPDGSTAVEHLSHLAWSLIRGRE
ncbi:TetR family transcriptional regulator C-terminal domain-containing protein [Streptomyces sp. NBC_00365]|uniref:TetR-like C-terminal domain-containing protein n=1 Tax=Streptomyces sp. NBC_00365 TaxID=2975726 RepID=UPI00224DC7B2|nr:TetR-like C-terminal domain-containing protein [Streptomyces sp. NBC_00365]MCX5088037.1 TetR family transcriptional regulator C-terminal domain-containing protein [Streptomyces sp. NBC_00365]